MVTFFTFTSLSASAQSQGFITTNDSIYKEGYIIFNKRNPLEVIFSSTKKTTPVYYEAHQLSAFGFHSSDSYESLEVQYEGKTQNVFLKVLTRGKLNLYILQGKGPTAYYIKKDEALIQLTEENLHGELASFTANCPETRWQLKRVSLTNASLRNFGKNINKGKCIPIAFTSAGALITRNVSTLKLSPQSFKENTYGAFKMTSSNVGAGLYFEKPLRFAPNLYYSGQAIYNKMQFTESHSKGNSDQDVNMDFEFFRFNLQPRFYVPVKRFAFFAEAGFELLYTYKQSSQLIHGIRKEVDNSNTVVNLLYSDNFFYLPKTHTGFTGGGGLIYYYTPKQYLSVSLNASTTSGSKYTLNNLSTTLRINL